MIRNVLPRFLMKHNVYSYDGKNEGEPTTTTMYQRFYSIFMHNPNGRLSTFCQPIRGDPGRRKFKDSLIYSYSSYSHV